MRKTLALTAVLLAACEARVQPDADGLRSALPDEAAIRIATPAPPPSPTATTAEAVAAAPEFGSGYARTTFWMATTVNAGVAWTLARLRTVAAPPPTTCDVLSCTWGPWQDREELNVWRLVARRDGAGWAYRLEARRGSDAAAPFAPIAAGVAYPGALPSRGNGSFAVDFDAAAALDHAAGWQQEDFGRLDVAYDAREAVRLDATALAARCRDPEDPVRLDAVYAFRATAAGGELQVALETLEASPRNLSLRSRWDAAGAGRGDAQWTSAGLQYRASECWSGAAQGFGLLYDDDPPAGNEGACAFVPAFFADVKLR